MEEICTFLKQNLETVHRDGFNIINNLSLTPKYIYIYIYIYNVGLSTFSEQYLQDFTKIGSIYLVCICISPIQINSIYMRASLRLSSKHI
jgi:hypothetical protein